jgi:hypothetical protein
MYALNGAKTILRQIVNKISISLYWKLKKGLIIMKLEDAVSGRKVAYTPFKDCDIKLVEEGIITSKNDKYVFVRYGADVNSKSTSPEDIEYIVQVSMER